MARPKSEFVGAFGKSFEIFKLIANAVLDLGGSDEDLLCLLKDKDKIKRIGGIIVERPKADEQIEFFTPLADADVPAEHRATLAKYRKLASEHDVPATSPVCYRVKAEFTLKGHAPKAGPCREGFQYLQHWSFSDEPTAGCLVFWVPRTVAGSMSKTASEQLELLSNLRARLELPAHHMSGFGQASLVAGLILAHFQATGERTPLNCGWVRTDTRDADGRRLRLGVFDGAGLDCGTGTAMTVPSTPSVSAPWGWNSEPRVLGPSVSDPRVLGHSAPEQIHLFGSCFLFGMVLFQLAASLLLASTDASRQYRVSCDRNEAAKVRCISVSYDIENLFSIPCQILAR